MKKTILIIIVGLFSLASCTNTELIKPDVIHVNIDDFEYTSFILLDEERGERTIYIKNYDYKGVFDRVEADDYLKQRMAIPVLIRANCETATDIYYYDTVNNTYFALDKSKHTLRRAGALEISEACS